jgi:uncharacterized protein YdaT
MPLEKGSDKATIERNVAKLISEGYSAAQAVAIAMQKAKKK